MYIYILVLNSIVLTKVVVIHKTTSKIYYKTSNKNVALQNTTDLSKGKKRRDKTELQRRYLTA